MTKTTLLSALMATAMVPSLAIAQTTPPAETPPAGATTTEPMTPPAGGAMGTDAPAADAPDAGGAMAPDSGMSADAGADMSGPFVTVADGAWRTSDLDGKAVEDANGENIGSITDVLVDENGGVLAVLVGVGGFLGIGAKDVAVSMDSLEFGPGAMEGLETEASTDTAMAPAGGAMAPAGGATAPAGGMATDAPATAEAEPPVIGEDNLPDRIVLNVTREELEAAPAYGEPESADAGAMDTGGAMAPAGGAMAPAGGAMAPAGGATGTTAPQ